jgi:uncharacterized glyoxalase superfamily protein PhnB/GNAT superfamily N-acetyltransferase
VNNRSMPPGDVIPQFPYRDMGEAVAWLSGAFGFTERLRIEGHRSQILAGRGSVVAIEAHPALGLASVMVRVDDVDAHYQRALQYGASISSPPTTFPYGERQYTAQDLAGHSWNFSQSVADSDPSDWGGQLVAGAPRQFIQADAVSRRGLVQASGNRTKMSLLIKEVPAVDAPMDLLLLADPSEDRINSYLPNSRCFVASDDGVVVGACVVQPLGAGVYGLMSIAVDPAHQRSGHGTALLKWIIEFFREASADQIEVGTGAFGYQLAFYQRHGFRVTAIDRDFFVKNYPKPVFDGGIQLFDMLRLTLKYAPMLPNSSLKPPSIRGTSQPRR